MCLLNWPNTPSPLANTLGKLTANSPWISLLCVLSEGHWEGRCSLQLKLHVRPSWTRLILQCHLLPDYQSSGNYWGRAFWHWTGTRLMRKLINLIIWEAKEEEVMFSSEAQPALEVKYLFGYVYWVMCSVLLKGPGLSTFLKLLHFV